MSENTRILAQLIKNLKDRESDPITPLIDSYFMKRGQSKKRLESYTIKVEDRPRPLGRLSPSTIGGCPRHAAFKFLGIRGRQRVNPDLELLFMDGDWRHHRWEAMMLDMEKVLGPDQIKILGIEVRSTYKGLFISGHLDILAKIEKQRWVIDIKGINRWGFSRILSDDAPLASHVQQLLTYMKAQKADKGAIIYEDKDTQKIKVFVIRYDNPLWKEVQHWCEEVLDHIRKKKIPPKHPSCDHGNYLYEKCPHAYLCWGDKTKKQIQDKMYRGFDGDLEGLWRKGKKLEAEGSRI